jgi:YD repeat-containing protein
VCGQTQPPPTPPGSEQPAHKEAPLKKFAGRYELETGILPISTLDITLEGEQLWLKPSLVKKRRLLQKSKLTFVDEVEGRRYKFERDAEGHIVSVTFEYEGGSYTAARVQLPPPSLQGNTTFRLPGHADANIVAVAGSFNNWNQSQLICARQQTDWLCRTDLYPGRYTYKFIVDGNWVLDPANQETEEDAAGNINNVLIVNVK